MQVTFAEPCDTAGGATLIADTGSGHALGGSRRGSGMGRRTDRFSYSWPGRLGRDP
jgi:hypothetical protein